MVKWLRIPLGPVQTNCYLLFEQESCLIIDPGEEADRLMNIIEENHVQPIAILLTHAHFDHIGAVDSLREKYHIPAYVHVREQEWLQNPHLNASQLFFPQQPLQVGKADHFFFAEGKLQLNPFSLTILETPGHSPGSVSFYLKEEGIIFSGDALFYGSIGRTDLPEGDLNQLLSSIKNKLYPLPNETVVLPGHGIETTIGYEKRKNPYVKND